MEEPPADSTRELPALGRLCEWYLDWYLHASVIVNRSVFACSCKLVFPAMGTVSEYSWNLALNSDSFSLGSNPSSPASCPSQQAPSLPTRCCNSCLPRIGPQFRSSVAWVLAPAGCALRLFHHDAFLVGIPPHSSPVIDRRLTGVGGPQYAGAEAPTFVLSWWNEMATKWPGSVAAGASPPIRNVPIHVEPRSGGGGIAGESFRRRCAAWGWRGDSCRRARARRYIPAPLRGENSSTHATCCFTPSPFFCATR